MFNLSLYQYTAVLIVLYLLCPLFSPLLFGRKFPNLSMPVRRLLFLPSTIAFILWLWFPKILSFDAPFWFLIPLFCLQMSVMFYPISDVFRMFAASKKLTIIHKDRKIEVRRKQLIFIHGLISRFILSHTEAVPQPDKNTVSLVKLENTFADLPHTYLTPLPDGLYAAVCMGVVVKLNGVDI